MVFGITNSHAVIIFSENFQGIPADTAITAGNSAFNSVTTNGTTSGTTRDDGAFGGGSGNIYGQFIDNDATSSFFFENTNLGNKNLLTLSFNFVDNSTAGDPRTLFRLYADGQASSDRGLDFRLNGGSFDYHNGTSVVSLATGYTLGTAYSIVIIANAGDMVNDYFGTQDIAPDTFDLYLDGSLIGDDLAFRNEVSSLDEFVLQSLNASNTANVLIDNITIDDTAVIPEPSTALLLGVSLAFMLLLMSRSREAGKQGMLVFFREWKGDS